MKKLFAALCFFSALACLCSCGSSGSQGEPAAEETEIIVFAAASLTETMDQIIALYKAAVPEVKVIPTYDSSGTLKTQIEAGADCDLFISAAQKQMDALAEQDFIDTATRLDLLENKVTLAVPEGNPAGIGSFGELESAGLIALGNSDVPVGSYSLEILAYLGLDVTALEYEGRITYGSNVKEVTTQVSQAAVDCGIIYATDAFSAGLTVVDTATSEMCSRVIYPAAVLKNSLHSQEAQAFLEFLSTDEAMAVFAAVGFSSAG